MRSEVPEDEVSAFKVLRSSDTNCSDCEAAFVSVAWEGEAVFFRSACTVVRADWAVDKSPALRALPRDVRSEESWDSFELLPAVVAKPWLICCRFWKADWAPFRSPEDKLFCRFWRVCCNLLELLDERTNWARLAAETGLIDISFIPSKADRLPLV